MFSTVSGGILDRSQLERVARRRFQAPRPARENNHWYFFPWIDVFENGRLVRKRRRVKLAPASTGEREARRIAAEWLRPFNQGLEGVGGATPFGVFVSEVYRSAVLPVLAQSTRVGYESVLKKHLLPAFGNLPLREITPLNVQLYCSGMVGSSLAYASRDKIRRVLSSVLGTAVQYGLIVRNPAFGVRLPRENRTIRRKPYVTPAQFHQLIAIIP